MAFESIPIHKHPRVAGAAAASIAAGNEWSMWRYEGSPSHGDIPPTTFECPDNTKPGGFMQTNPAAGKQKRLVSANVLSVALGRTELYDRLLHVSGLDASIATLQNINGGSDAAITRHYADENGALDVGNELFFEIYTQIGATPVTATVVYKNESGASKTTTTTLGGTGKREAERIVRIPLVAGDRGVSAVVSVQLSVTTGTAGNFGLIVTHRLLNFAHANNWIPEHWYDKAGKVVESGACLAWAASTSTTVSSTQSALRAHLNFVDK